GALYPQCLLGGHTLPVARLPGNAGIALAAGKSARRGALPVRQQEHHRDAGPAGPGDDSQRPLARTRRPLALPDSLALGPAVCQTVSRAPRFITSRRIPN